MPLIRQRSQSSFTFEIKRASKRTPERVTLRRTSSQSAFLADEVFGPSSARPLAEASARFHPAPVSPKNDVSTGALSRRVLPDLLSVHPDPVAERMQRLSEKRAARRAAAAERRRVPTEVDDTPVEHDDRNAVAPSASDTDRQTDTEAQPPIQALPAPAFARGKRKDLRRAAVQAERSGQPLPRLPAGQRWKRRLPKECW